MLFFLQDVDGDEDTSDITGGWVHPGEYASSGNYFFTYFCM